MLILEVIISMIALPYFAGLASNSILFLIEFVFNLKSKNFRIVLKHMLAYDGNHSFYNKFISNDLYKQLNTRNRKIIDSTTLSFDSFWAIFSQTLLPETNHNLSSIRQKIYSLAEENEIGNYLKTIMLQFIYEAQMEGTTIKSKVQ